MLAVPAPKPPRNGIASFFSTSSAWARWVSSSILMTHGVAGDAGRLHRDALLAQGAACIVQQRAQPVGLQRICVDFEHEVGAALQV